MPKGRILAVDDQRYFRELLEGLLTQEGFEVQTAAAAEEALRILDHADFDIVLTDLVMPGMDGNELVHRIKQRNSEQDIVVVTGVVDVKTAVEAMKLGASEYLLKPFDRQTLGTALETVLQRRRLKNEHDRLLAENIEFMGERTLLQRASQLFSCLSLEPLVERIVDGLCVETGAQAGVLWVTGGTGSAGLVLASARGLVRLEEEPRTVDLDALPTDLREGRAVAALVPWSASGPAESERPSLCIALCRDGRILGFVQLAEKLGGEEFDPLDVACAEKFAGFAEGALSNALRVSALERGSLEDPTSGAHVFEYFEGVARTEIEKAARHGRSFALLKLDLGSVDGLRRRTGDGEYRRWLKQVVALLQDSLRTTDLLAADGEARFLVLLPDAEALGAAVLKQRIAEALAQSALLSDIDPGERPSPQLAAATYPGDGTQLEALLRVLDERVDQERRSPVRSLGLEQHTFAESLRLLLDQGEPERAEVVEDLTRFTLGEVARLPKERGLMFVAPGEPLREALHDGLAALRGLSPRTEIVVVAEAETEVAPDAGVTFVSPPDAVSPLPFVIHYGEGPAYVLVRDSGKTGETARLYHTSDRSVVEHLAFRLQRELAVPALL